MKKILFLSLFIVFFSSFLSADVIKQVGFADQKKIMIISSYHFSATWTQEQMKGYGEFLTNDKYEIITEFLDARRFYLNNERMLEFRDHFNRLYDSVKFDIILITDNTALEFVNRYYLQMPFMKDVPLLSCGISNYETVHTENIPHVFIIKKNVDVVNNLKMIKDFFPSVKAVCFIDDYSGFGIAIKEIAKKQIKENKNSLPPFAYYFNDDLSFEQLQTYLQTLPDNTAVIIGSYCQDKEKNYISPSSINKMLNSVEKPVFTLFYNYLDSNVIGGKLNSAVTQGRLLGEVAAYYLQHGCFPQKNVSDNSEYVFNYHALKKYHIKNNYYTKQAIIREKPDSLSVRYKQNIISSIIFILVIILVASWVAFFLKQKVTKRTKQRDELVAKLKKFIDRMPIGCIETDAKYNILSWNPASEVLFGHKYEDVYNKNIIDVVIQENNKEVVKKILHHLEQDSVNIYSYDANINRLGKLMFCDWYFTAIRDNQGKTVSYFCMVIDKTENEQLKKNLLEMVNKSKNMMLNHDRFVANSMHDLKNLITPIVAYSEMMTIDNISTQKIKSVSEQLNRSASMLVQICTELMNISKIRGNITETHAAKFNIYETVRDLIYMTEANYSRKNITVKNQITPDMVVYADEEMISSVFLNLLSNAAKFTDNDGKITITGSYCGADRARFTVEDNGTGLKTDHLLDVIEEKGFYSTVGTAGETGTGLGLILSKDLVNKNGGVLEAYNGQDGGAVFCFTLPLSL